MKDFPNFAKTIKPQMQGTERIKSTKNKNRITLGHIITKMLKANDKYKILETAKK